MKKIIPIGFLFCLIGFLPSCKETKKIGELNAFKYEITKGVTAKNGAVVSAHPLASEVGVNILKAGGNAVDAAIGTMFALLDYNPRIKQIDGRLFPFGFIKLLTKRKELKRVRLISTNVLPEYQSWGIGIALVSRLVPDALAWGIQEAEFSWVLESNDLSFKTLKKGGAKITKTYRVYDYGPPDTTVNAKFMQQDGA